MARVTTPSGGHAPERTGTRAERRRLERAGRRNCPDFSLGHLEGAIRRAYPQDWQRLARALKATQAAYAAEMSPALRPLLGVVFDDATPERPPAIACRYDRKALPWL